MTLEKRLKSYNATCGGNVPKVGDDFAEMLREEGPVTCKLRSVQRGSRSATPRQLWRPAAEKPRPLLTDERVLTGLRAAVRPTCGGAR